MSTAYTLSQGGIFKVSGTYTVTGDEIDVTDKRGPWTCPKGERTGSYHWETTLTGLAFTKIADECEARSTPMTTGPWTHKTWINQNDAAVLGERKESLPLQPCE